MAQVMLWPMLFACLFHHQVLSLKPILNEPTKGLKRDDERGINFGNFIADTLHYLDANKVGSTQVTSSLDCGIACVSTESCFSYNLAASADANGQLWCELLAADKYSSSDKLRVDQSSHHYSISTPCSSSPCPSGSTCIPVYEEDTYKCECLPGNQCASSCSDLRATHSKSGVYTVIANGMTINVYCHMGKTQGWTLIARFSNNDDVNWMKDDGEYWYDRQTAVGQTTDPADNADMISPAFWSVKGSEFKITKTDSSVHTGLLITENDCMRGNTFRTKITSYGDFRDGSVWASDKCLGNCKVKYNDVYASVDGFQQAQCNGEIQTRNYIGFWCDWGAGDGAVMMIGGGGSSCSRADHGIGITEANAANFVSKDTKHDFGSDAVTSSVATSYSLNLWIRD